MKEKPNVFLWVIDSLRADAVFGSEIATPNLDSLADRGVAFTQCISTTSSTTPSFASILTGRYPPHHGVRALKGHRLSSELPTLAEILSSNGYSTYARTTGPLVPQTGILRGFERLEHHRGEDFMAWRSGVFDLIKTLRAPWFVLLHTWEVHRPYRAPPDFKRRLGRRGYRGSVQAVDDMSAELIDSLQGSITFVTGDHGEEYADTWMGDRVAALSREIRRRGKLTSLAPSLERRFANLAIGHGYTLSEEVIRVPLLVAGPGIAEAKVASQVRHVDLLPTIVDLAGLPVPDGANGRSLIPLLRGESLPEEPAYLETGGVRGEHMIVGARTSKHKLLISPRQEPRLYRAKGNGVFDERRSHSREDLDVVQELRAFIDDVTNASVDPSSGMTPEEEAVLETQLRDLGYL